MIAWIWGVVVGIQKECIRCYSHFNPDNWTVNRVHLEGYGVQITDVKQ